MVREGASVFCVARNAEKLDALLTDLRVRGQSGQHIAGCIADLDDVAQHETLWQEAKSSLHGCDGVLLAQGRRNASNLAAKLCPPSIPTHWHPFICSH